MIVGIMYDDCVYCLYNEHARTLNTGNNLQYKLNMNDYLKRE